nr:PREDICTED: uncharacterized protein LOC656616 [Tribolium castaneum]|eukprot:XP_976204.2 PREDICTED: uncharacterized protein LOC656616 [Tribolium castaneum]
MQRLPSISPKPEFSGFHPEFTIKSTKIDKSISIPTTWASRQFHNRLSRLRTARHKARKMKFFIFSLIALISIENSICMECYSTNLEALARGVSEHSPQDCTQSLKKFERRFDLSKLDVTCFKFVVQGEDKTAIVKGCLPKGGCGLMEGALKTMLPFTGEAKCYECEGSLCNSAPKLQLLAFVSLLLPSVSLFKLL